MPPQPATLLLPLPFGFVVRNPPSYFRRPGGLGIARFVESEFGDSEKLDIVVFNIQGFSNLLE